MDKQSVILFFDKCADHWDNVNIQNNAVINEILDLVGIKEGTALLDIACGTGVLFEEYINRGINDFVAIDISPEMVKIAKEKYKNIPIICGDAEEYNFNKKFDSIMIFNAFPHFVNPGLLFSNLVAHLNYGGRLSVAHGASRDAIISCHSAEAKHVSNILPDADELAGLMSKFLCVDVTVSDDVKYVISGYKKIDN